MNNRVVITGLGVIAPNGNGVANFHKALLDGVSGLSYNQEMSDKKFASQVAATPSNIDELKEKYLSSEHLLAMNNSMIYGALAAIEAYLDAGLEINQDEPDWETGAIIGTGISGLDVIAEKLIPKTDAGKVRRLGSTMVEQVMASSASANIGGLLGLGGQVTTNSSACSTGTEAIVDAFYQIHFGRTTRMLAGGTEGDSVYSWAGFDAMRVLSKNFNDTPEMASRPMSESACGFVPASGSGVLMLESLESAKARGAKIYGEIIGGSVNCGGQRQGGSITFPNPVAVQRCIKSALAMANIEGKDISMINGHLTATMADPVEISNWQQALELSQEDFPLITATKSMIGHALGAAGGLEAVASVLQLYHGFVHGNLNSEDLHPELKAYRSNIPQKSLKKPLEIVAKASFGFGDVNACLLFKKFN
jgi:3-oxoacyl-(acyl-carrier-protein) synthase